MPWLVALVGTVGPLLVAAIVWVTVLAVLRRTPGPTGNPGPERPPLTLVREWIHASGGGYGQEVPTAPPASGPSAPQA